MTQNPPTSFLKLSPQGRLVIPAHLRELLKMDAGSSIEAQVKNNSLVLRAQASGLNRFAARFEAVNAKTRATSTLVSDELIAERRQAAQRESA